MNKHRAIEIICVVFLVIFIFMVSGNDSYSDKTVKEVSDAVTAKIDMDALSSVKKNKVKAEFGIDFSAVDSFAYYASESIMTVDEVLIIKLKEGVKADDVTEKIETRIKNKQVLFEGYAPQQSALLKDYVLKVKDGFVFYAVGEKAKEALATFTKTIR